MADTIFYPYVRDNSTNLNPDKTPVWTYCAVSRTYEGHVYFDGLPQMNAYFAAHPVQIISSHFLTLTGSIGNGAVYFGNGAVYLHHVEWKTS